MTKLKGFIPVVIIRSMNSVALVVLDTLRYDRFCEAFDWLPGRRYSRAYSTSHWTVPAHASLITGRYPQEVSVTPNSLGISGQLTLPIRAEREGYRSVHVSTNPQTIYHNGWQNGYQKVVTPWELVYGSERLFDWQAFMREDPSTGSWKYMKALYKCVSNDCKTLKSIKKGYDIAFGTGLKPIVDDSGAERVLSVIRDGVTADADFAYLNLMEAHTPYRSTGESGPKRLTVNIGNAFADDVTNPNEFRQAYDNSVAYLSGMYKEIFSELNQQFDYVITISDHGELLGEHGYWNHGYGIFPELVHIPIVISGLGIEDRTVEPVVSLFDVHQTIADFLDLETESRGQNLLESPDSNPVLTSFQGFLPHHKRQFNNHGISDLYDAYNHPLYGIADEDGYGYQIPGNFKTKGTTEMNEQRLIDLLSEVDFKDTTDVTEQELSDALLSQLEDLGYA